MADFLSFSSTGAASTLNAIGKAFAIIEFEASGKIKWANEVFCKAMGYSPSEIKGRHHSMFVDPEYAKSKEYAAFWEKLRTGQHESHEFKRFAKDGKEVWIQASYNPIVSATGRVSRIVKIAADITAAKQKSLLDAGKIAAIDRAQAVIEFMPDGTIVTANSNFLSAVGYKLEEIAGKHHRIFVDPAYAKSHEYTEFWQRLSSGEYEAGEYDRYGKGGKKIWIQASYNPIFDPAGKVTGVVKFATDVTDRVEAVERLASGLGRLAVGDLKEEIATPFPSSIEKLRVDFNKTVASLRDVLSSIGDISSTIDNGAQEIASASDDLSSRTEQNAANLEETAAAIQEITTTVNRSATGAKEASSAVSTAKTDAEQGGAVVGQAIEAMGKIEKSSQEINQIISVIDEIAFQTNLLALNAGVEAARAGEAGRGFAVVASEVRSLAQRSADAAKEIKELISTSTSQVGDGVKLVAETGEALERIVNNIVDINSVVTDIAASAQEQAATLQQVNEAAVRMDQSTQQNAAMSEEATAASRSLAEKSRELAGLINKFELGSNSLRSEMQRTAPHVYGNPNRAA